MSPVLLFARRDLELAASSMSPWTDSGKPFLTIVKQISIGGLEP
jgi:hypothetical protein